MNHNGLVGMRMSEVNSLKRKKNCSLVRCEDSMFVYISLGLIQVLQFLVTQ